MKKIIASLCFMLLMHGISAQSLLDIYKRGAVKLTPDTEYGRGNDWEKVFANFTDTIPTHNRSIVMMPNGSVVVNYSLNAHSFYSLFDANGRFVREFGITRAGRRAQNVLAIQAVMNNHFITTTDNMGNATIMDFNGNFVRSLKFDHSVGDMVPLTNNKIAIVGFTVLGNNRTRNFVAIVDFQTNEQKVIWEHVTTFNRRKIVASGTTIFFAGNEVDARPSITFANNQLVVALPHTGDILFYDVNGTLRSRQKVGWPQKFLSVAEQKESERKIIERVVARKRELQESGESRERLQRFDVEIEARRANLEKISEPRPLPMFANVIRDSDGNLLFFEVPEREGANQFNVWVFQNNGGFVAKSSFVADGYDLSITPSRMVFHNGFIYALTTLKNTTGNPLRLVRFRVSN